MLFENAEVQLEGGGQGVAIEINAGHTVRVSHVWNGDDLPEGAVAQVVRIGPEPGISGRTIANDRVAVGGKDAKVEIYDAVADAVRESHRIRCAGQAGPPEGDVELSWIRRQAIGPNDVGRSVETVEAAHTHLARTAFGQPSPPVRIVGAHGVADAYPGPVLPQQHEAVFAQVRPVNRRPGPRQRLLQGHGGGHLHAKIGRDGIGGIVHVTCGRHLLQLAREHLGHRSPRFQPVHLVHAAAEGALDLAEHGEQTQDDETQQGDGNEDFDQGKRSVVRSRHRTTRSVWSARSSLSLSDEPRRSKAPASWPSSMRFKRETTVLPSAQPESRTHYCRGLIHGAFISRRLAVERNRAGRAGSRPRWSERAGR